MSGAAGVAPPDVIVTPVYEDAEAASRLFQEIAAALGRDVFIVAVDDGSIREPLSAQAIASAGLKGLVLKLKRNVGHQRAISVGLAYVAENMPGATCVIMDSDGEDLPSTVPALMSALRDPQIDIAAAVRRSRVETLKFKIFYVLYRVAFQLLSGRTINFGNYMALKPAAVRRLADMPELGTHVAATVLISRLRIAMCPLDRGPRYVGKSKLNFSALVLHGFRAVMIFAEHVLVRIGILCVAITALSIVLALITTTLKIIGMATPGWFSITLGIMLVVLLQMGALTLITLMMTGIIRGLSPMRLEYQLLIDSILRADGDGESQMAQASVPALRR